MEVKEMIVTIKYTVGLGGIDMPKDVFLQLKDNDKKGVPLTTDNHNYMEAKEWIRENIAERDSFHWEAEVLLEE